MKRWVGFVIILCFLFSLSCLAKESESRASLSPAIPILTEKRKLMRGTVCGSLLRFSQGDFTHFFGEENFSGIVIHTLPDQKLGKLQWMGMDVWETQAIPVRELDSLTLLPSGTEIQSGGFQFSKIGETKQYTFSLQFGDEESISPESEGVDLTTFTNVAIYFEIETVPVGADCRIEITQGCKNGVLERLANGNMIYHPQTNHSGGDSFRYQLVDHYGNRSKELTAYIRTKKAPNNLFFYDLVGNEIHYNAVYVCAKGWMDYEVDASGLPVFQAEKEISQVEFLSLLENTLHEDQHSLLQKYKDDAVSQDTKEFGAQEAIAILENLYPTDFMKESVVFHPDENTMPLNRGRCAELLFHYLSEPRL